MSSSNQPRVFGTGLVALDLVLGPDPNVSVWSWAGGTCGNVLAILSYLGWEAFPVARMNNDPASKRVRADFRLWDLRLDFISCEPTSDTPIVIQKIGHTRNGRPEHRFSWSCPKCGKWLPAYRPVRKEATETVAAEMTGISVFFFDRLSLTALSLARIAASRGAVVVFEPSGRGKEKLLNEAISVAHIVKYSDQRIQSIDGAMGDHSSTLVEIQTLGENGLRYRHRFGRSPSKWLHLNAIPAPRLIDSCGAGDWVTAGLLAKSTVGGIVQLKNHGARGIRYALRYGQALASWNCGFEGARGGMYTNTRVAFEAEVDALISGRFSAVAAPVPVSKPQSSTIIECPACSTTSFVTR